MKDNTRSSSNGPFGESSRYLRDIFILMWARHWNKYLWSWSIYLNGRRRAGAVPGTDWGRATRFASSGKTLFFALVSLGPRKYAFHNENHRGHNHDQVTTESFFLTIICCFCFSGMAAKYVRNSRTFSIMLKSRLRGKTSKANDGFLPKCPLSRYNGQSHRTSSVLFILRKRHFARFPSQIYICMVHLCIRIECVSEIVNRSFFSHHCIHCHVWKHTWQ